MDAILKNFFNLEIAAKVWPFLLKGLWMTLMLSAMVVPLGCHRPGWGWR